MPKFDTRNVANIGNELKISRITDLAVLVKVFSVS